MNTFISRILVIAISFLLISWYTKDNNSNYKPTTVIKSYTNDVDETTILNLLNQYRIKQGLSKLLVFKDLKTYTDEHTNYMIAKKNISHDNAKTRFTKILNTLGGNRISENVAYNQKSSQEVVDSWIASPGHRNNILSDATHFNLSAKQDANEHWYYTTIFIKIP